MDALYGGKGTVYLKGENENLEMRAEKLKEGEMFGALEAHRGDS